MNDPAAWTPGPGKMRTPVEYVTASYRLLGLPKGDDEETANSGGDGGRAPWARFPLSAPLAHGAGRSHPMLGRVPTRCSRA